VEKQVCIAAEVLKDPSMSLKALLKATN